MLIRFKAIAEVVGSVSRRRTYEMEGFKIEWTWGCDLSQSCVKPRSITWKSQNQTNLNGCAISGIKIVEGMNLSQIERWFIKMFVT